MADIKNKNELKRRIELFLDEFTSHEYKINEEFCKETMKMMREFIGHTDNRINVLITQKEKKDRKIRELQSQIPKWHLVADGDLPKDDTAVNAYIKREITDVFMMVNISSISGKWQMWESSRDLYDDEEVIAWMELPKFSEVE